MAFFLFLLFSGTLFSELSIVESYPAGRRYSAQQAMQTPTHLFFKTELKDLALGESLRFWLQSSLDHSSTWKNRVKGEIEVCAQKSPFRCRGHVQTIADTLVIEMAPLALNRSNRVDIPHFRVAQALKKRGESWHRQRKKRVKPELNKAIFSPSFQMNLDIVYVDAPFEKSSIDNTTIYAERPKVWNDLSFTSAPLPYTTFFIALGGTNISSIIPNQVFHLKSARDEVEFWACQRCPIGYREKGGSRFDTTWWGVCPVRVSLPPLGESTTVLLSTEFQGQMFQKQFTIYGPEATRERLAERKINTARYSHLLAQMDPAYSTPKVDLALLSTAKKEYERALENYRESKELTDQVTEAYIRYIELEHPLLERCHLQIFSERCHRLQSMADTLQSSLAAASIACDLGYFEAMLTHLQTFKRDLERAVESGIIDKSAIAHFLLEPFPTRSYAPFATGHQVVSFLQLLKQWAWLNHNPDIYKEALELKKRYTEQSGTYAHNPAGQINPQEYRELAQLTIERLGDRERAEIYWNRADRLLLDSDSPFYDPTVTERELRMLYPGWWPHKI